MIHKSFVRFPVLTLGLAVIMLAGPQMASAAGWVRQFNTPAKFYAVHFFDPYTGLVAGVSGKLMRTTDAGKTWTAIPSGVNWNLNEIAASSAPQILYHTKIFEAITGPLASNVWIVGGLGTLIKSTDEGQTWAPQVAGTNNNLNSVSFVDANTGWVVGQAGIVLTTSDGGQHWNTQISHTAQDLNRVTFVDMNTGWAVGNGGTIIKTTDGGQTWNPQASGVANDLLGVSFSGANNGFISARGGLVLKTTNGGATWNQQTVDVGGHDLQNIQFISAQEGWAITDGPNLYRTRNGGVSWDTQLANSGNRYLGIHMLNASEGWVVDNGGDIEIYDALPPTQVGSLSVMGGSPINNSSPMFTWTAASDMESGFDHYSESVDPGGYVDIGNVLSFTVGSKLADGTHVFSLWANDKAGNRSQTDLTFVVDTLPPAVGQIAPLFATAQSAATFTASATDTSGIANCHLYVGGADQGVMNVAHGVASLSFTFLNQGSYVVYAKCRDQAGNEAQGNVVTVTVAGAPANQANATSSSQTPTAPALPSPMSSKTMGTLIKLACPNVKVAADHPCKAVYFSGSDGKRHAFPNEKVYFTWYANFDGVQVVSGSAMAAIPLGKNATYKPGSRMVKFTTLAKVYAVAKGGTLRWVANEDVARALYGSTWNKKIDDIADTFYLDYTFGADIHVSADYDIAAETAAVTTIDENF